MSTLQSVEEKRRWTEIHDILQDLMQNQSKVDAVTDLFYKLVWGDAPKP